ncbi:MAG: peptidyl-prolyl cis-trans isomerase [Deltaproteobacteria bacterium]|jgi:hypothetical protein|nr:peptidyl-prolyl cis-trans isomerase [Deltaproteobacteria bacterium]MBW2543222.1 peptidyl-prolyl cis-trans isomerase [Deltaproteobacteria bacterium]
MQKNKLARLIPALLILAVPSFATVEDGEPTGEGDAAGVERAEEVLITLEVPLGSPLFTDMPVAVVDEEPITFRDLTRRIASIHEDMDEGAKPSRKNFAKLLDRVITTQLVVHEARNIGLDELPEVVISIENASTDLLISRLMSLKLDEVEPDPDEVDALYEEMSREFLMSTVKLPKEEDALAFEELIGSGENFDEVATQFAEEGRAEFDASDKTFIKLKDLLPRMAQTAIDMEEGSVSEIFSDRDGFLLFHVGAVRGYDDPELREEARQKVLEPAQKKAAREYGEYLRNKYATVDERLLEKVDFEVKKTGFLSLGKEEPVDFAELEKDERVVATTQTDPPLTVTIGELATAVRESYHHGIETSSVRSKKLNAKKQILLKNMLFKEAALAEARNLGLDQTSSYLDTMDEYTTSLLFEVFVKKVIVPDVAITDADVREYFEGHLDEFSTPAMFRLNAIAFGEREGAERALGKLEKRADFKWVSANSPGRIDVVSGESFDFDGKLLAVTALPEDLHESIEDSKQGDAVIYSDGKGYHHVIVVSKVFPSETRPYEDVKGSVARIIFEQKLKALVEDWSGKLAEAYETRIFITGLDD